MKWVFVKLKLCQPAFEVISSIGNALDFVHGKGEIRCGRKSLKTVSPLLQLHVGPNASDWQWVKQHVIQAPGTHYDSQALLSRTCHQKLDPERSAASRCKVRECAALRQLCPGLNGVKRWRPTMPDEIHRERKRRYEPYQGGMDNHRIMHPWCLRHGGHETGQATLSAKERICLADFGLACPINAVEDAPQAALGTSVS